MARTDAQWQRATAADQTQGGVDMAGSIGEPFLDADDGADVAVAALKLDITGSTN